MEHYTPNIPLKQCLVCERHLPATPDFFNRYRAKSDILRPRCKDCTKSGRQPIKETLPEGYKRCRLCKEVKKSTLEFFHRYSRKEDGLHNACKDCLRERGRQYFKAHKEEDRARNTAYKRTHVEEIKKKKQEYNRAHRQELRDSKRAYIAANRERVRETRRRYRETHQEQLREYERNYAQTHRDQLRVKWSNRRAYKKEAPGTYTKHDVQIQYKRQRKRCYYCKQKLGSLFHVDHVMPLSKGGSNDPSNLVVSCPTCNMRKHNKLLHEWPEGGRLL